MTESAFELFPWSMGSPHLFSVRKCNVGGTLCYCSKWNRASRTTPSPRCSETSRAPTISVAGTAREQRDGAAARASSLGQLRVAEQRVFRVLTGMTTRTTLIVFRCQRGVSALAAWVAPAYLDPEAWPRLREHFANDSAARLVDFCRDEIASERSQKVRWRALTTPGASWARRTTRRYGVPRDDSDLGRALAKG